MLGNNEVRKFKNRCSSDNKKKLDTQNLLELYTKLDKEKAMSPLFVAATLAKVLGDTPAECDVLVSAATLSDLKSQITDLQHTVSSLAKNVSSGKELGIRPDTFYPELKNKRLMMDLGEKSRADRDGSDVYERDCDDDCNGFIQSSFAKQATKGNQKRNIVKSTRRNKQFIKESRANQKSIYGSRDTDGMTSKLRLCRKCVHGTV